MSSTLNSVLSVVMAVGFHAAVVGLLLMNWDDEKLIETTVAQPYYIEASVVAENPYKVKKKQEQARKESILVRQSKQIENANRQARLDREAIEKAKQLSVAQHLPLPVMPCLLAC